MIWLSELVDTCPVCARTSVEPIGIEAQLCRKNPLFLVVRAFYHCLGNHAWTTDWIEADGPHEPEGIVVSRREIDLIGPRIGPRPAETAPDTPPTTRSTPA